MKLMAIRNKVEILFLFFFKSRKRQSHLFFNYAECIDPFVPPPCWSDPCEETQNCLDPTLNGTVWNETAWAEWLWEEWRVEYDNTTEGYEVDL